MTRPNPLALIFLLALLLGACGGGGGGTDNAVESTGKQALVVGLIAFENESNDAPEDATNVVPGLPSAGDLSDAADVDVWRFEASAGDVFRVTLHAVRLGTGAWNAAGNVPILQVLAPDGATVLQTHSLDAGWEHGTHDLDFPFVPIKQTGSHFLRVDRHVLGLPGGPYAFQLERVELPNIQVEFEQPGAVGRNDDAPFAQVFEAGTMIGHLTDDDEDWYELRYPARASSRFTRLRFVVAAYRNGKPGDATRYADLALELYAEDGVTRLASDSDSFFSDPALGYLIFTPENESRTLYLRVTGHTDVTVPTPYFIELDERHEDTARFEAEPNDTFPTADQIAYGELILASRSVGPSAGDRFRFEGNAGDMIRLWVWHRPNFSLADTTISFQALELRLPDGFTPLPFDRTGQSFDVVRAILPETGTYTIFVPGVPVGQALQDSLYALELELVASAAFESEPNAAPSSANGLDAGGRAAGQILDAADADFFQFSAIEGDLVKVLIFGKDALAGGGPASGGFEVLDGHGSQLAPQVGISDMDGRPIARADYATGTRFSSNESIVDGLATMGVSFIAPETGQYLINVRSKDERAGPEHIYHIHVSRIGR